VIDWRRGQLLGAGFSRKLAEKLACDGRFDLHALIELVERGCAPALAARILAPPDDASVEPRVVERARGGGRYQPDEPRPNPR
jgi:hypothetical protein